MKKFIKSALIALMTASLFMACSDNSSKPDPVETVADVTFNPVAGVVDLDDTVTLSTTTEGAVIYYEFVTGDAAATLSADNFTGETIKTYAENDKPVITAAGTLYAIAVKDGETSKVTSAAYTLSSSVRPAKFSLEDGEYASTQTLTITTGEQDGEIYVKFVPESEPLSAPVTAEIIVAENSVLTDNTVQLPSEAGTYYAVVKKGEEFSAIKTFTFTILPENSIRTYAAENEARTEFAVYNYKDLLKLAELVNGGNALSGVTIIQFDNITINEELLDEGFNAPAEAEACKPNANFLSFEGIGSKSKPFSGTYDGDGYMISGAYVYGGHSGIGIFGGVSGATIKDVIVLDSCVVNKNATAEDESDDDRIGGLVGCVTGNGATVENCVFVGTVGSAEAKARGGDYQYVGGLVGAAEKDVTITNSFAFVNLYSTDSSAAKAVLAYDKGGKITTDGSFALNLAGDFTTDAKKSVKFNIDIKNEIVPQLLNSFDPEWGEFIKALFDVVPLERTSIPVEVFSTTDNVTVEQNGNRVTVNYDPAVYTADSVMIKLVFTSGSEGLMVADGTVSIADASGIYVPVADEDDAYTINLPIVDTELPFKQEGRLDTAVAFKFVGEAAEVVPDDAFRKFTTSAESKAWSVYGIKDLEKLASVVNGGETLAGYTITQAADVKFNEKVLGENWTAPLEASAGKPNDDLVVFDGIGNKECGFAGTYDGQGYKIEGVYVYGDHQYLGFFGRTDGAILKNIVLLDACSVTAATTGDSDDRFGGLIGDIKTATTVENCVFVGTVGSQEAMDRDTGLEYVGGIAGRAEASGSTVTGCLVVARIYAEKNSDDNRPIVGYKAKEGGYFTFTNCVGHEITADADYTDAIATEVAEKIEALVAARQ